MKEQQITKEIVLSVGNITMVRPGGNDTALVTGINYDQDIRKDINVAVMAKYPNIEQVGFIDLSDPTNPILQMAGGEFCGNATRSTAFLSLEGKPGEVSIQVSGVNRKLRAGVDNEGNAWAEMPVPDVIDLQTVNGFTIVPLDGITQVIVIKPQGLTDPEEIKQTGMKILESLNLVNNDQVPASGVMFVTEQSSQINSEPIVWVRNIKTCFYETACGSGTAAVGLWLATKNSQNKIDISVLQPSGMPINVKVDLTQNKPSVIISGPITILDESSSVEINKSISIKQIVSGADLEDALETGLIDLYQQIFSQEPYNEFFTNNQVRNIFTDYLNANGLIFMAKDQGKIVGFSAAVPTMQSSIADIAKENKIPADSWYMADLGVKESFRLKGLARQLVESRLNKIPQGAYVMVRTAKSNIGTKTLYQGLGFEILDFSQAVSQFRVSGETETDNRIFLGKYL